MKKRAMLLALSAILVTVFALVLSGCGGREAQNDGSGLRPYTAADTRLGSGAVFPRYVTADVKDGYQFALSRPDVLQYLPCYCGCGLTEGHTSNLSCFIAGVDTHDGTVRFDDHGTFCDICLQIARDGERLLGEGKTLSQVRAYVDRVHGEKGPGTDTPWPPQ